MTGVIAVQASCNYPEGRSAGLMTGGRSPSF
ncbi:hypothetical protein EPYR_02046 [Erwinia pyrifoliae DSM 12163]|nr:hypothetical protein EPYR_02046 [Erwinia pyrifoliae DSM 12163]